MDVVEGVMGNLMIEEEEKFDDIIVLEIKIKF